MTSGPDTRSISSTAGPSLSPHGIHELSDCRHYWHLAIRPTNHLRQLAGTLFCNHPQAPVSPPVSYQVTQYTLSAIDGAPSHSHIIGPFMFRPHGDAHGDAEVEA
jgi:hypothetical protein